MDDTLFLIKGTFLTKATNLINLKLGAKVTGASDSSFIDGPVKKTGNTAFVFPTGANNSYRPIEISAPATTTSEFTAEFMEDSVMVNTDNRDATLSYLFRNKYWALERNSGSSNVYVTLSWSASNAVVDTFISVSSWNGSQWKDLGHGTISGDSATGTIKSNTTAAYYNEFTIGYLNINTLPNIPNCSSVQNPAFLRFCLVHTSSGTVSVTAPITINNSAALGPGFFPIPIHSGVILEGLVGGFATKWWEPNCPLITADHKAKYEVDNPAFPIINLYLFSIQPGATIQNLRIRGANLDHKDFNDPDFLCGGIYVQGIGNTAANILNCEIFGFSQAGIWKNYDTDLLNIDNCYIHKVKGRSKYGIGYGAWLMSEQSPIAQVVNITNTIFDDCKAAIDGQDTL
ncbi:MAG: hypothetical protein IPP71_20555 [Bacteroidetes bacterium]|nr:hypothetical protein [Bacteroidota bacterium]